jgi:hypothetical protein
MLISPFPQSPKPWDRRVDAAVCMALAALVFAVFAPLFFAGASLEDSAASTASLYPTGSRSPSAGRIDVNRVLDPGAAAWQTEPEFALEHRIVVDERALPLWNPYSGYGMPLLANMQSQPLSPLAWPIVAFDGAGAYDLWIVSRFVVGAVLMYAFCRRFFGRLASFGGGVAYGFCGYFMLYFAVPEISVLVVSPGLLLAIEAYARRRSVGAWVGIALAVATIVAGGMPESAFLIFSFGAIYAVVRVARLARSARGALRSALAMGSGALLGLGLSAVVVFPFLEYLGQAQSGHGTLAANGLRAAPFSLRALAAYVAPLLQGPPYNDIFNGFRAPTTLIRGFFGPAVAALALAASFDLRRGARDARDFPRAFISLTVLALFLKHYGAPGIQQLGGLPILRQITLMKYDEAIVALCVSMLCAYSIDRLSNEASFFKPLFFAIASIGGVLVAVLLGDRGAALASAPAQIGYFDRSLAFALGILMLLLEIAVVHDFRKRGRAYAAAAAVAVVTASAVCSYVVPLYYVVDRSAPRAASALLGAPYIDRARALLADGRRIFSPDRVLFPEWSAAFALPDVRAVDAIFDERYRPFLAAFPKAAAWDDMFIGSPDIDFAAPAVRHWLELSAIGAVVTQATLTPAAHIAGNPHFTLAYHDDAVDLYRAHDTLAMVSAFSRVAYAASDDDALARVSRPTFDPLTTLIVRADPATMPKFVRPARFIAGRIDPGTTTSVRAEIALPRPEMVLDAATDYPGWNAYVDGARTRIYRANYLFRAIVVPAGRHHIEFRYEPSSVADGLVTSAASLGILVAVAVTCLVRTRRMPTPRV